MNKQSNNDILRKCVGCQNTFERTSLVRIMAEFSSENILIEPENKYYGRSVYLCHNNECLKNALKKNRLSKVLKRKLSDKDIERIKRYFNNAS